MILDLIIGGVTFVGLLIYLLVALVRGERF